jgi:NAD(P)-dependent dehydrogenase (short-subunit alcohol dehydrogenase family)
MEKIALVTGSTSNIGKAIAQILSTRSFHVIVTSRHGAEAREVSEKLPSAGSHAEVDFSDAGSIDRLFDLIRDRFGGLDVLVNNVAYTQNESILDCDLDTWERTLNTNLRSYYLCTKLAAQMMKGRGGGSIVNITVSSTRGMRDKFSYIVSKGGVNALTLAAAVDLAPLKIRVNAVGSGLVGTPVGYRAFTNRPFENTRIPLGHIGEPRNVAEAVAFLVSEQASYITGAVLPVDGGFNISM